MARKQKFDYFDAFIQQSALAAEYANELVKYMEKNAQIVKEGREPNIEHAITRFEELHTIEAKADSVRHSVVEALGIEFLPPLEIEDIMSLSSELDDLVDELDEVLQRMYMYDVHVISGDVLEMMKLAHKATVAVHEVCKQFPNFKKHEALKPYILAIEDTEEEADHVYIRAMHDVFAHTRQNAQSKIDALEAHVGDLEGETLSAEKIRALIEHTRKVGLSSIEAMGSAQMLNVLEDVCDSCESIGGSIATIMMKNS